MTELVGVAQGVLAWCQNGGHGRPNAAAVIDTDGITIVDTLLVRSQWQPFLNAITALDMPIRRCVLTSSHLAFVGGTPGFWKAAMYGRQLTSVHLDQPPSPEVLRRLHPDVAEEIFDDPATRPITHVVDEPSQLTPAAMVVPTQGHQVENLIVAVPGAEVTLGGAMCWFNTTPLCFDGDPAMWAGALAEIAEIGGTVVPGYGPIGGVEEITNQRGYLLACCEAARTGEPVAAGPWDQWDNRHFDEINIEKAAMSAAGDPSPPPSMFRMLGL
jgi:hypothetical protein